MKTHGVNLKMHAAGHTAKQELTNLIFLLYFKKKRASDKARSKILNIIYSGKIPLAY